MSRNLRDFTTAVYGFDAVVRRAPASAWTTPSACDGWTVDPLCHTFDLAVAAGVDPALDEALVERYHRNLRKAGDMLRVPGMFGPEVEAPADATPAEAFLAFAGRNPRP